MRRILFSILFLSCTFCGSSQNIYFDNQIDYNQGLEFIDDLILLDSGYLIAGGEKARFTNNSNRLLTYIDEEGNKIWEKSIDSGTDKRGLIRHIEKMDTTYSMTQGTEVLNSSENWSDLFLSKVYNSTGDTLWTKYYGSDTLSDNTGKMIRTSGGGFAIVGWSFKSDTYRTRFLLIKTDSIGNEIYQKRYTIDSLHTNLGLALIETEDKGFILSGIYRHQEGVNLLDDLLLFKVDSMGNEEWSVVFNADEEIPIRYFGDILPTLEGNFILCGWQLHGQVGSQNHQSYALKKITPEGDLLWEYEYGQNKEVAWASGIRTSRNTYVFCGYEADPVGGAPEDPHHNYGVLSEVDSQGNLLWHRKYRSSPDNQPYNEFLYEVKETPDGGYIAVGTGYGNPEDSTYQNGWVIKTDSIGCLQADCDSVSTGVQYLYPPKAGELIVTPNPASAYVKIWVAEEQLQQVKLYDLSGELALSETIGLSGRGEELLLSVESLSPGMYVVVVQTDVRLRTGKLVVAH